MPAEVAISSNALVPQRGSGFAAEIEDERAISVGTTVLFSY